MCRVWSARVCWKSVRASRSMVHEETPCFRRCVIFWLNGTCAAVRLWQGHSDANWAPQCRCGLCARARAVVGRLPCRRRRTPGTSRNCCLVVAARRTSLRTPERGRAPRRDRRGRGHLLGHYPLALRLRARQALTAQRTSPRLSASAWCCGAAALLRTGPAGGAAAPRAKRSLARFGAAIQVLPAWPRTAGRQLTVARRIARPRRSNRRTRPAATLATSPALMREARSANIWSQMRLRR